MFQPGAFLSRKRASASSKGVAAAARFVGFVISHWETWFLASNPASIRKTRYAQRGSRRAARERHGICVRLPRFSRPKTTLNDPDTIPIRPVTPDACLTESAFPQTDVTALPAQLRDVLLNCLLGLLAGSTRQQVLQTLVAQLASGLPGGNAMLVAGGGNGGPQTGADGRCTGGVACLLTGAAPGTAAWCADCRCAADCARAVRPLAGERLVVDVAAPVEPSFLAGIDCVADALDRALELTGDAAASASRRAPGETGALTRELHDSVAQQLGFMSLLVARLQQGAGADPVLAELRTMTTRLQRQVRELITSARLTLDGRSLQQALAESVAEFSRRCDVVFELDNRLPDLRLEPGAELHLLQIVREALSNVVRHAQARHAWVELRASRGGFQVSVMDDGVGLGLGSAGENHYGLNILHERARAIGAALTIGAGASGGTRVHLFVPRNLPGKEPSR
ncbi:histidine kinase/DNA gyrase B/HSP90-like ATPase [Paraburkholderia caballeronis]|nr:histidine kinase/DNA gyrase B/HSP90-like ATPase [Paraburkholderia caballeronis]